MRLKIWICMLCAVLVSFSCKRDIGKRQILDLNGTWLIAETIDTVAPKIFERSIQVPGLSDLAQPEFGKTAYAFSDIFSDASGDPDFMRNYYWYKKEFKLEGKPGEFTLLKVHKAKFGHAVYVNGNYAGEYPFCFTPSFFNISKYVRFGETNELLIRVGAHPNILPDTIPYGFDIEKENYYAGIYDNVEIFIGNFPYIENAQVIPDIENEKISVVVYLEDGDPANDFTLAYKVFEKTGSELVAKGSLNNINLSSRGKDSVLLEIELASCRLWSPEDPFLYELLLETPGDSRTFTFGMREFKFDTISKLALLNGKTYFLRGTNIALHRFFEDPLRKALPWDTAWIWKLHDELKKMHWNSHRFHIGMAPEIWYEVADEKGFLVQDEYAFWGWGEMSESQLKRHSSRILAQEYETWMRERWNHPSVVIWDAQNETITGETGKAIEKVRRIDLSDRPWDNGFSAPQRASDMLESHPYLLAFDENLLFNMRQDYPEEGFLQKGLGRHPLPFNDPNTYTEPRHVINFDNPLIVNEYAWLWLYRDGSPANVAESNWEKYPQFDTPEKRWDWRGRVVAAMTEYWRSRRNIAGVHHFCILTCERTSEPRTQVSDEWLDVEALIMQPGFKKYVQAAFAPVGIYIDRFDLAYAPGEDVEVPLTVFSDLYKAWEGELLFEILGQNGEVIQRFSENILLEDLGDKQLLFKLKMPERPGKYEMKASLSLEGEMVFSTRIFNIQLKN